MQQTNLFQNTMIKWENSIVQCEGVSIITFQCNIQKSLQNLSIVSYYNFLKNNIFLFMV